MPFSPTTDAKLGSFTHYSAKGFVPLMMGRTLCPYWREEVNGSASEELNQSSEAMYEVELSDDDQ